MAFIPSGLSLAERYDWEFGWQFELEYFIDKPPSITIDLLPAHIKRERRDLLAELYNSPYVTLTFDEIHVVNMALDRILLSKPGMSAEEALKVATMATTTTADDILGSLGLSLSFQAFANAEFIADELGGFLIKIHTAKHWLTRMKGQIPASVLADFDDVTADEIIKRMLFIGILVNERPSSIAAGVLVHLLGAQVAEPYLCGYVLEELKEVVKVIEAMDRFITYGCEGLISEWILSNHY